MINQNEQLSVTRPHGRKRVVQIQRLDLVRRRSVGRPQILDRDPTGHYWLGRKQLSRAEALRWLAAKHFDCTIAVEADWDDCEGMHALLMECADTIEKGDAR